MNFLFSDSQKKVLDRFDKGITFSFCALIYFLPISIALLESWAGVILILFFIKRGLVFYYRLKHEKKKQRQISLKEKGKLFLKSYQPVPTFLNKAIAFFILANFLSVITSQTFGLSVKGFFFKTLECTFLYFIFVEAINSKKRLRLFVAFFLLSSLLVVSNGFVQFFAGKGFIFGHPFENSRVSSSFRHANDFSGYLIVVNFLLLSFAFLYNFRNIFQNGFAIKRFIQKPIVLKVFVSISFSLCILMLGLTLSRAGWVGFIAGLFYFLSKEKRKLFWGVLLIAFFVVAFSNRVAELRNLPFLHSSGRIAFWEESWHMIKDFPIYGVGLNAYSVVGRDYKITWGGYPHNSFLQMAVELGLVGIFTFGWILVRLFVSSFSYAKSKKGSFLRCVLVGTSAGLFGFFAHSFFDTNFYSVQLSNFMWIIMGVVVATQIIDETKKGTPIC